MIYLKCYFMFSFLMVVWKVSIQDNSLLDVNLFEGDILGVDSDTILQFISEMNCQAQFTGWSVTNCQRRRSIQGASIGDKTALWYSGKVYYEISEDLADNITLIENAFDAFRKNTCIKFIKRTDEPGYIYFALSYRCASVVGHRGGIQILELGSDCLKIGTIIHEIMHAIGFYHEHSRWDRDKYVTINYDNIADNVLKKNFMSYKLDLLQDLHTTYDYDSIMHYASDAFAKDSVKLTIVPKNSSVSIGNKNQLSSIDIQEINLLYECNKHNDPLTAESNFIRLKDDICWGTRYKSNYRSFSAKNADDCIEQCASDNLCGAIAFERDVQYSEDNCYFYNASSNYTLSVDLNWKWGAWKKDQTFFDCVHQKPTFQQERRGRVDYQINVKTTNIFGAGTDANVFIQLIGTSTLVYYSKPLTLTKSLQNYNKFERNSVEQFLFRERNYGELIAINVWHDNSGIFAPWHLEYIEVLDNGLKYRFQCNCWLSTDDDNKISRNLQTTKVTYIDNQLCWGYRLRGGYYVQQHSHTIKECIKKCEATMKCEAITFNNEDFVPFNCFFFNSTISNYTSHVDLNLQWGIWKKTAEFECEHQSQIEWGMRFIKHYKSLRVEQHYDCVKWCKNEITCDAITFNTANMHPDANCYLINMADIYFLDMFASTQWGIWEKNATLRWLSDLRPETAIQWGVRFTNHFASFNVSSVMNCKLQCKKDVECKAMTFHIDCKKPCLQNCYFFNSIDTTESDPLQLWGSWKKN